MRKSKYFVIGNSGTEAELIAAFKRVAAPRNLYEASCKKREALTDGALLAFRSGHPENLQTALSSSALFNNDPSYYRTLVKDALHEISEKSNDKLADINLAVSKMPEEKRKDVLGYALYSAILNDKDIESFVDVLLKAGADPNAEIDGRAGKILARAIRENQPDPVIKLLYDNGASFDAALQMMQADSYFRPYATSLMLCRERIEKKPAATTEAQLDRMEKRLEGLAEQVGRLSSLLEAANANQPQKQEPPQRKSPAHSFLKDF